jgi:uncharacterized membrane protein YkvA (DUF1232 family)
LNIDNIVKDELMSKNKYIERIKYKVKILKNELSALFIAYKRKDVPIMAKITIIMAVGYALSPIDLIPDFIPIIGYLDDLLIVPFLVFISLKLIPKEIMDECREQAKDIWKDGKPKKWYYAIPIIVIYLFVVFLIIKSIFF